MDTEAEVEDDVVSGKSYWKKKEALRNSTVSLAVGDHFSTGI